MRRTRYGRGAFGTSQTIGTNYYIPVVRNRTKNKSSTRHQQVHLKDLLSTTQPWLLSTVSSSNSGNADHYRQHTYDGNFVDHYPNVDYDGRDISQTRFDPSRGPGTRSPVSRVSGYGTVFESTAVLTLIIVASLSLVVGLIYLLIYFKSIKPMSARSRSYMQQAGAGSGSGGGSKTADDDGGRSRSTHPFFRRS